ncbi:MAG TPA: hypothetical protein VJI69_03335 [Bacteroidia bacterium]|nr:hypothetical protein [Bacteroidia bacterium]
MKGLFIGIFLCALGGGIIWYLEKNNRSIVNHPDRITMALWVWGLAILVAGIYFIATFFGVDFRV